MTIAQAILIIGLAALAVLTFGIWTIGRIIRANMERISADRAEAVKRMRDERDELGRGATYPARRFKL